jgi:hypothetical protein
VNRHAVGLLRRLDDEATGPTGRCYILAYLSCAGTSAIDIRGELRGLLQRGQEKSLPFLFAATRALNRCGSGDDGELASALLPAAVSNRRDAAMQLSALLDAGYDGPGMPELIESVLSSAANPTDGATMALMLSALFRASATASGVSLS